MENKPITFFPKYFSSKAIATYVLVVIACIVVFYSRVLPLLWIIFGLVEVICFFQFSQIISKKWTVLKSNVFEKKLFETSLLIRAIYVIIIYYFYIYMNDKPFEFEGLDSFGYHTEASMLVDWIYLGKIGHYFAIQKGVSDLGFPLWLTGIYFFSFNSIMVARLANALMDTLMCILLYRLARRNFGEEAARITGILAMLSPILIFYSGLHDKETVMNFILVAFVERADYFIRLKTFKTWYLLAVALLGGALFLFRTVLAVAAWFALFSALLFSADKIIGAARKAIYITWFIIAAIAFISTRIGPEIQVYVKDRNSNQQDQMRNYSTNKGANKLAVYGSAAVFMPMILFAPFPTLVYIEDQPNAMMMNGNLFTRNILAFFILIAFFSLYKRKLLSEHVLIITLPITYLIILSLSGFAFSERFHMPVIPFLLLFAGYGVSQMNKKNAKFFIPYLIIIGLIIFGWNWFKLAGRGVLM